MMLWLVLLSSFLAQSGEVQISPSQTEGTQETSGPTFVSRKGFDLPSALAALYATDPNRIVLPAPLNDKSKHYDFLLKTAAPLGRAEMQRSMREGIEKHFKLTKTVEHRTAEVYVMTAVPGRLHRVGPSGKTSLGQSHMSLTIGSGDEPPAEEQLEKAMQSATLTEINVDGEMAQIRMILERGLHRPVIDETGLKGEYAVRTEGHAKTTEEFLRKLKDQTGLDVFPARRTVDMLVFKVN